MRSAVSSAWLGVIAATFMITAPVSAAEVLVWDQGEVVELSQRIVEKLDSLYRYGRQEQFEQERSANRQLIDDMRRMRRLSRALASRLERGQDRDETMGVFVSLENVLRQGRQNLSTSSLFRGAENDLDAARQAMTQLRGFYYDADLEPPSVAAAPPPTLEQASPCWEEVRLAGVSFEFASDEITSDSASTLDAAAKELSGCEEVTIEVEGHTDSTGPEALNMSLSDRRAASVKSYLVTAGIGDERISTQGHGPNQPIATNDTREGRALNRRVEIDPVQKD